jgi:hypothetical protein
MKKKLLIFAVCASGMISTDSANAQVYASSLHPDSDFGIKGGVNYQAIMGSAFKPAYNAGYVAGIYGAKHWDKVGLRIEVLASSAHYTTEKAPTSSLFYEKGMDTVKKGDFNCMYLSVPILLEIKLKNKLFLEVGPQYNYLLSTNDNNGAYTKQFKNDNIFKSGEYCFDIGINYNLSHHFNIGARFVTGINNINKDTYPHAYDSWTAYSAQAALSIRL